MKYKIDELDKMASHLSQRERVAQKASRDSVKYKQCQYLMDKIGKIFDAVVTSVQDYGVFINIPENGCEGLVKTSDFGPNTWTSDVKNHCFIEQMSGRKIRLGDEIKVIVKSIDLEKKEINMTVLGIN